MLTKTGSLLMRKKHEIITNTAPNNQIQNQQHIQQKIQNPKHKKPSHISHVNQYRLLFETNRSKPASQTSNEISKLLEVQNFRLIEQNMKIVEWSKTFLASIKQNILRIIYAIQQFKYLQGVNKMYELLSEVNYYQESGLFAIKNIDIREHYLYTFRHENNQNPQSKNIIPKNPDNFVIQPVFTINLPQIKVQEFSIEEDSHNNEDNKQMNQILWSGIGVNNKFLDKMNKQKVHEQSMQNVQDLYHLLLMQSLVIQSNMARYY